MPKARHSQNGITKWFTDSQWAKLPHTKHGWVLAAEEPEEVTRLKANLTAPKISPIKEPVTPAIPPAPKETKSIDEVKAEITSYQAKLSEPDLHHKTKESVERKLALAKDELIALEAAVSNAGNGENGVDSENESSEDANSN